MEEKRKQKKNKIIKGVALLGLFLLVFGVSYAIFSVVLNGAKRNKITTGNLSLTLTDINGNVEKEGTMGINLEGAIPITDEEGLKTEPYQFVVENTGTIPASYTLNLINDGTNTLQDQYIKYNLKEENYLKKTDNTHYRGGLYNTEPKLLSTLTNRMLDEITILPGEKIVYTLNLWLDHDADNDAMGKEFNAKIEVDGTQAMAYTKGKAGDNVEYTLYKDGTLIVTGEGEMKGYSLILDESGNATGAKIENNMTIPTDIILKKLREKDVTLFPNDINKEYTEMGDDFGVAVSLTYITPYISTQTEFDYNYIESCHNGSPSDEKCSNASAVLFLFDNDLGKIKQALTYLDEIPKIKNITIDEKITALPMLALMEVGSQMLTLSSTISKMENGYNASLYMFNSYALITPPSLKTIPDNFANNSTFKEIIISPGVKKIGVYAFPKSVSKATIPSSVEYVGHQAFEGAIVEIDNTEEYVKNNWDAGWCVDCSVKYLR